MRSATSTAAAVSAIRTTLRAAACPAFTAPGRPRKRKIATGTVGQSPRAMKTVAPNSPSEIANANPAATPSARRTRGRSISRRPGRGAPSTAAASLSRSSIERRAGARMRTTNVERDERLGDRDEPGGPAELERRLVEGEDEAEAEHDRRGAEREHHERVEPHGARAGDRDGGEPADDERDRGRGRRERERVQDGVPRQDEQRRRLLAEHAVEAEPVAVGVASERRRAPRRERPSHQRQDQRGHDAEPLEPRGRRRTSCSRASGTATPARRSTGRRRRARGDEASWSSDSAAAARRSKRRAAWL